MCANPRSFSQLTTSFVASESLGIRHTPLTISFLIFILVYFYTRHSKVLGYLFVMSLSLMSMIYFASYQSNKQILFLALFVTFKLDF